MTVKRTRSLTPEDRILWGKVARTATPIHGAARMDELISDLEQAASEIAAPVVRRAASAFSPLPPKAMPARSQPPAIDRPTRKKIDKGRVPIEARIDLHGLYQGEAHAMLLSFLSRAHGEGLRLVLVITGKGSSMGSDGVLNRAVPSWFATAPFRGLVSGYDFATRRHGGEGAFYVRLRRRTEDRS